MDLGSTIKNIRKQKGIKQIAFAELCNLSQTYLSQIENNVKEPNISTLREIAQHLNIPLPVLFFLSLNEEDVSSSKKQIFQVIGPTVKTLIKELIADEE